MPRTRVTKTREATRVPDDHADAAERRWSVRRSASIPVSMYQDGVLLTNATTRDIGLEGMFVETASLLLTRHTLVDVELSVRDNGRETRHCLQALVVRVAEGGVGVMFVSFDQQLFRILQKWLYP